MRIVKIAVDCKSPLLQKSLELFLSRYLSSSKHCDIIVRDVKCVADDKCFYISNDAGSDLLKPFSKSQLILALENKYEIFKKDKNKDKHIEEIQENIEQEPMNFDILKNRIETLTNEYQESIFRAIKAFYEK